MFRNREKLILLMVFALFFCISGAGAVSAADAPVANFTSNSTTGSAPLAVQFNDTSSNNPTSWNWDFGDNETSTDQNPTHTYIKSGKYNVTLITSNDAGSSTLRRTSYITVLQSLNDAYVSSTGNDTTGDGSSSNPYATIQTGLNNLANWGTIHLQSGTYTGTGNRAITISQDVNIVGVDQSTTVINAQSSSNIFSINSGVNVTITNLTFTNGTASSGGAIYTYGNLNVSNCTFTNNTASGYGGAIYNYGTLNVNNSIFTGHKGKYGSAIYSYNTFTLSNSTFNQNNATLSVIYGRITSMNNCNFTNNTATISVIYLFAVADSLSNSNFSNNTAASGMIYVNSNGGITSLNNCSFNNNSISRGIIGNYGIITNITNCNFSNNTASAYGGAILNSNTITNITGCNFINNTAPSGGVIYNTGSKVNVHFSSFVNNHATTGSTIYSSSGTVNAENNWWGSNNSPANQINGTVDYNNWLYMTETVNPNSVANGGTVNVVVNFNNIYNGTDVESIDPSNGHIIDGTVVNFSSILGTFNPTAMVSNNGIATTTFTATSTGYDLINAITDNQTVSTYLTTLDAVTPVANFTANTTKGASPLTVQFTDTSINNPTSWLWDFGDGTTSTDENPIQTYSSLGNYTVTLIATNAAGSSTLTQNNYINMFNETPPSVNATPDQGIYNQSKNVVLTSDEPESTIYYTTDGSDPTDTNNTNRVPYSNPIPIQNTTVLNFAAVNTGGIWSSRYSKTYVIDTSIPFVTASPLGGLYTTHPTVTLTGGDADTGTTVYYTTDGTDPKTSGKANVYTGPIYIGSTTTLRYVAVDHATNWSPEYTQTYDLESPVANFTSNTTKGSASLNVQFNDTSSNNPTSWLWDFGDGTTSTDENPTHTYTKSGIYNVSLTATNDIGNSILTKNSLITVLLNDVYVSPTGSDTTGNGTNTNPFATIQNGLNFVTNGGTIHLQSGTYKTNGVPITVTNNVTFMGENPNTTVINATTAGRIFVVSTGVTLTVANLTLTNATADTGGAIYSNNTSNILNVTNCNFLGNNANNGAAIYNIGTITLNNCSFTGNTGSSSGVALYNTGRATVNNSIFTGNKVNAYGTIYNTGNLTLTGSSFINNTVSSGGALYNTGNSTVTGCSIINNTASSGGAIYNTGSTSNLTVHFSSFVNNHITGSGIIYRSSGTVNAEYNWWGSNNNPSTQVYGTVDYTNWLYMTQTVNPIAIPNGSIGAVIVSFNNACNGTNVTAIDPANGHIIDGTVVTFSSVLGTLNPVTTVTTNGIATTIFTATGTQIKPITATTDNQTVSTYLNGLGTAISVANVTTAKDSTTTLTATLTSIDGSSLAGRTVTFTINGNSYNVATDSNGVATMSYTPHDIGVFNVTASYAGDSTYGDSTKTGYLTVLLNDAYVSPTGSDTTGDGTAANPYATIQNGLNNLISGGTLHLTPGTYVGTGNSGLTITKNVNIIGTSQTNTTINGQTLNTIFTVNSGLNVTIANLYFTYCKGTNGGAIYSSGNLTVNNCTFNANTASAKGGAIYNAGTLTVNNSIFIFNAATSNHGGAIFNQGTLNVNNSIFSGNTANMNGGAIFSQGTMNLHFNSFSTNHAATGTTIYSSSGNVNAENNWWGTNNSPVSQIYGTVDYSNWIYMTITTNTTTMVNGTTSSVTVNFNNVYNGTDVISINPASGHTPDGTTVNFSSTIGTFNPLTATTVNGIATTIFTATNVQNGNITATTDNQAVSTLINVTYPAPEADFTADNTNGTAPQTVKFKDRSTGNVTGYSWDFGDGSTSTDENPTHVYSTPGTYTVTLTVTGPGGSSTETFTDYITVNWPAPVADFTASTTNGTKPLNVKFNDLSTGNVTSYSWDFGDGSTSTDENPTHVYSTAGTYTVTLTVTGPGGSSTEIFTDYITVNWPAPVADFTANSTTGTAPETLQFTDKSTGNISSYAWDFNNDGITDSTVQNPTWTYSTAGTYTVTLTVTGPGGSSSETFTDYININPDKTAPSVNSNVPNGLYNTKQTVTLTAVDDKDPNPKIYYTLDGSVPTTSSTLYSTPIVINKEGTTLLRFIAVDMAGNISNLGSNIYTIDTTNPTASANVKTGLYNKTQTVTLSMSEDGNIYYTLNGTTPTTSSTQYTGPITVSSTTTLKYIAIDLGGNSSPVYTETYTIDKTAPTANDTVKSGLYNTNKTVKLAMNKSGIIYYTLNGSTPTASSNKYTGPITLSSTTTLKYIAIDLAGNKSPVYTETYTIDKKAPTATASVNSGTYSTNKAVKLTMNEKGTIYYTLNGKTPTASSTKYTGPISIKSTSTLKFFAVDLAGNKSPVYTKTYTIDKTAPKPVKTTPAQNSKNVSLTAPVTITFGENISKSINFSKIYIKNLSTGKIAKSTITSIKGNTVTLKMTISRLSLNNYQIYIPAGAVKDKTGNNNTKYVLNFKTSKY